MLIVWDKEFEVGNEELDTQHQTLLALLVKLQCAAADELPHEQLFEILLEIRKYAEYHFLTEEHMMADVIYPRLREHEKSHSDLLSQLNMTISRFHHNRDIHGDILQVLHSWIMGHLLNEDMKFAPYMQLAAGAVSRPA